MHSQGATLALPELLNYRRYRTMQGTRKSKVPARGRGGASLSRFKGRGMEFDEVRHYQNGDDIRAIDWRVTARTGKTHTKLFREEKERPVFIMTDFSHSMLFGSSLLFKSVQAAHVAAAIAWQSAYRGDRVGGLIFNDDKHQEVKPLSRDKGVLRFIHSLVESHQQALNFSSQPVTQTLNDNLQRLQKLVKTGAEVYLLSDFHELNTRSVETLRALSIHNKVQAILLQDPMEQQLPASSPVQVSARDGDFEREFWLGLKSTNDAYAKKASQWYNQRLQLLNQARIPVFTLSSATPLPLQWQEIGR
ncbi:DUF58 domain-containing protein [Aliidiomarina minuta]|uniref:DUF58 domain-containing protein n=2 Tax=Aliidiomarina minuta TaxID=880057 RepID=A0A432WAC7_9GAMM|nr:DUF58 domain-containing protein [Aliidiomarina minuta]